MVEGLPIGAWGMKIGQEGICNLCTKSTLNTIKCELMQCAIVWEAWNNFRDLRVRSFLVLGYSSWEEILLGDLHQPCNESVDEETDGILVNHTSSQ